MRVYQTKEIERLLRSRATSYGITAIVQQRGRLYTVTMNGVQYRAIFLHRSFQFYEARYHLAKTPVRLVVCYAHDTVLPCPVLSLKDSALHAPLFYPLDFPREIDAIEELRKSQKSKIAARVLLGLLLNGVVDAIGLLHAEDFPASTRRRYFDRMRQLNTRRAGSQKGLQ